MDFWYFFVCNGSDTSRFPWNENYPCVAYTTFFANGRIAKIFTNKSENGFKTMLEWGFTTQLSTVVSFFLSQYKHFSSDDTQWCLKRTETRKSRKTYEPNLGKYYSYTGNTSVFTRDLLPVAVFQFRKAIKALICTFAPQGSSCKIKQNPNTANGNNKTQ